MKLGFGDWGLGIGDLGLGPIPNPQSPIPIEIYLYYNIKVLIIFLIDNKKLINKNYIKYVYKQFKFKYYT